MSAYRHPLKVLLADDEDQFRESLAERLAMRGFLVLQATNGQEAVRIVRADREIDVVILDRRMPGMEGKQALRELKVFRPEVQVIMLTGHGSVGSAREAGQLGVFRYLAKPVPLDELVKIIREAGREKFHALARQDMPAVKHRGWKNRLKGSQNLRPLMIILGALIMLTATLMPPPENLVRLLDEPKTGDVLADAAAGYPAYQELDRGETIAGHYVRGYHPPGVVDETGFAPCSARRAQMMIGLILTAALFWASGAVPLGITALVVAVVMYAAGVMHRPGLRQGFGGVHIRSAGSFARHHEYGSGPAHCHVVADAGEKPGAPAVPVSASVRDDMFVHQRNDPDRPDDAAVPGGFPETAG